MIIVVHFSLLIIAASWGNFWLQNMRWKVVGGVTDDWGGIPLVCYGKYREVVDLGLIQLDQSGLASGGISHNRT